MSVHSYLALLAFEMVLNVTRTLAKPRRRRAKQVRSQASVGAVLEAAAQVLLHEGYAAATTNRIAARAGVSIGTLYQYFGDKEAVFAALIEREVAIAGPVFEAMHIDPEQRLEDSLARLLNALRRAQPHGPELYRQLDHVPNKLLRKRIHEQNEQMMAFVRQLLEAYRGSLAVDDLDLAAFLLVHATSGIALGASPDLYGERLSKEVARLFARYLEG